MTLRVYLLSIILALAFVPVLLVRFWPGAVAVDVELAEARDRHLVLARSLAAALTLYHRDLGSGLALLAAPPAPAQAPGARAALLDRLHVRQLCFVAPSTGRVIRAEALAELPCPDRLPRDLGDRFNDLAPGATAVGPARVLPDGRTVFHLARAGAGILAVAAVTTEALGELGGATAFGARGHAVIVDADGHVLWHPDPRRMATRLGAGGPAAVLSGAEGIAQFDAPGEGGVIAGYAPVAATGWGVLVTQPLAELQSKAQALRRSLLAVLALGVAFALAMTPVFTHLISRPVERISALSREVARGRLDPVAAPTVRRTLPAEIRDLHTNFRDMVERLRGNARTINDLAFKDTVTALANRGWFRRRLGAILDLAGTGGGGALIFLDLDGFKAVNDAYGHEVGDEILREVALRIREVIGVHDLEAALAHHANPLTAPLGDPPLPVAARLGGDEFAIFVVDSDPARVEALAARVLERIGTRFRVLDYSISIGCSMGIATLPEAGGGYSALLRAADLAMYAAKRAGKNRVCHFTAQLGRQAAARKALADEMALANECGEIFPYFQPQYDARTLEMVSVEALARWRHPARGLLESGAFIDVAREARVISGIDGMMFRAATAVMRRIATLGCALPDLSVNVSAEWLADPRLLDEVRTLGPQPFGISFELIESVCHDHTDDRLAWTLEQLDALGVGIELDDFGTGHASITALLVLRPRFLKIDGTLVNRIATDRERRALVRSIVDLGSALGIGTTAECVETEAQLEILRDLGCARVQGRLLAPPMPAGNFIALCAEGDTRALAGR